MKTANSLSLELLSKDAPEWLRNWKEDMARRTEKRRLKAAFARKKRASLPLERRKVDE